MIQGRVYGSQRRGTPRELHGTDDSRGGSYHLLHSHQQRLHLPPQVDGGTDPNQLIQKPC